MILIFGKFELIYKGSFFVKIGNLEFENEVFLAPMAGVTDSAFRRICKKFGCGMVYTEMISSKALLYNDKKTFKMLEVTEEEKPFAVQIFGSDAEIMAQTAYKAVSTGACMIDINMGCPVPKVALNGEGSALMRDCEKIYKIVKSVSENTDVPVSVKIRKGWDENNVNAVEAALAAESGGAKAITVHGRTREQMYTGKADLDIIAEVVKNVSIPVIGNGDIFTAEDAVNMRKKTGCAAVMVARGAMGNPFIFRQINELMSMGTVSYTATLKDKVEMFLTQFEYMMQNKGEHIAVCEARKHAAWYLKGEKNSAFVRKNVNNAKNSEELKNILKSVL